MDLWTRYLAIYREAISTHCEKPLGFISEPVNTLSNIAFFISAYFIYKLNRPRLFWLSLLIGLGSTTYHAFNNPFTLIIDVLPVYAFIIYFIYAIATYTTKNILIRFLIPLSLIFIQIFVLKNLPAFILDIPTLHIINLLFLCLLIIWFYKRLGKVALKFIPVVFMYGLAISVRGLDMPVCPINNFGTHFLWHILASLTIYLAVRTLVKKDIVPTSSLKP